MTGSFGKTMAMALLSAALVLSGCGRPAVTRSAADASAPRIVPVAQPRFGDADPHEWEGRHPGHYPVHGIDVSRWQGAIDWRLARANGVSFAYMKATEGGDHTDPAFDEHWRAAAAAGLPRGAYHHYYFCRSAAEQARWYIAHVPRAPGALPPVLDIEWTPFSRTCRVRPPADEVRRDIATFARIVGSHYGQRPMIYTTVDFYRDNDLGRLSGYEFWLRSVAGHPAEVYPGQRWTLWQYTGTGLVPGVERQTDINAFSGSAEGWSGWLAARAI